MVIIGFSPNRPHQNKVENQQLLLILFMRVFSWWLGLILGMRLLNTQWGVWDSGYQKRCPLPTTTPPRPSLGGHYTWMITSYQKIKRESEMVGASSGLSNAVRPSPAILWDVRQRRVFDFLKQIGTKISVMISLQTQGLEHKEGIGGSVVSVGPEKIGIRFRDP